MIIDFSFILVAALFVTGVIWAIDAWLFKPKRPVPVSTGAEPPPSNEPIVVEYARSFFPIILIVVVIRSFLLEPFRIPSDSMMPGLLNGDFIFVNKYAYGLRLPVLNDKVISIGDPQRGDVIVFRLPSDPSTNYIKRLVGLPGDHVVVRDNHVFINGTLMPIVPNGLYTGDARYEAAQAQLAIEQLGDVKHSVMLTQDRFPTDYETQVPPGHYFFMGDNRNNSQDSRFREVGFVPEQNLVGRAVRIWMNWRAWEMPVWSRIGTKIE
jgi:signal peptidase I